MQKKILSELREVLDGRLPGVEDLPKLRYTAMVLTESMRLYPPTWIFIRIAQKDQTLPSGATNPAGAKLYLCQYVIHRNSRYWPNCEQFDPEQFSESAKKKNGTNLRIFPFGGGVRVCIGEDFAKMEGVLVLASIAQRFALTLYRGRKSYQSSI